MIKATAVAKAIGVMSLMKFFPGDEEFRAALAEMLGEICHSDEELLWLARRVVNLYSEWPGIHEVRATLCSKTRPRDGIEVYSAVYLDGIPSEKTSLPALESSPVLELPEGSVASADPEAEKLVGEITQACAMPPLPKYRARGADERRVDAELRALFGLPDEAEMERRRVRDAGGKA